MKNSSEMQKGKTTCACGAGCNCGCGHSSVHRVIWWVAGIIILIFVFALGVKAGEFRDELHAAFGNSYYHNHSMMQDQGEYGGGGAMPMSQSMPAEGTTTTSGQ